MRFALALSLAAAAFAQTVPQAAPPVRDIRLLEGRGQLLRYQKDIQKVVIAEPKVADAVVVDPRAVMVNAKGPGYTTLLVWETGEEPVQYEIAVVKDTAEWDLFRRQIFDAAGGEISVSGSGETVVLAGNVANAGVSKRLAGIAQTRAKNVINLLQHPAEPEARQILLQVKFAAIDRVALSQVGFNLFSLNDKVLGSLSTQQFSQPRLGQFQVQQGEIRSNTINFADLLSLFAFRPDLDIGATVKALQQRNLLQILAEPNLIALEGKEASFVAGGQFPFPTITTTPTTGGTAPVISVQFKPFGVKLDFLPTVTPQGAIHLKVAPEVSALDYANAVTLQGFTIPAIAQRRAETEVVLRDGESFAIAGLIDNRVIQNANKIPGLGTLPILGSLFRSRALQKSNDELLVVITPHFVRPLGPEDKVELPEMPQTFLPSVQEEKSQKGKNKGKPATITQERPEFVGPRGQQLPKQ